MQKKPGHYVDEQGHKYYWDGQTRSYIPDNSFGQFLDGANKVASIFVLGYAGVWILAAVIFVGLIILFTFGWAGSIILLLLVLGWGWLVFNSVDLQEQDLPGWNSSNSERQK